MTKLQPLPEFPTPRENLREIRELMEGQTQDQDWNTRALRIKIQGENGWTAEITAQPAGVMGHLLGPLMDWWEQILQDIMERCPESHGIRKNRTTRQQTNISADLSPREQKWWVPVTIQAELTYRGSAVDGEILWPINLDRIINIGTDALWSALGKDNVQVYQQHHQNNSGIRVMEDFGGAAPGDPTRASHTWARKTGRLSQAICEGTGMRVRSRRQTAQAQEPQWMHHRLEPALPGPLPGLPGSQPGVPVPHLSRPVPDAGPPAKTLLPDQLEGAPEILRMGPAPHPRP